MGDIVVWVIIGIVAAIALAAGIYYLIKFIRLSPEEKKKILIQFLLGLVDMAEIYFAEGGEGAEKLKWVEEQFKKTAPWFLKLLLMFTKSTDLRDLIEKALEIAKHIEWDKYRNKDGEKDKAEDNN